MIDHPRVLITGGGGYLGSMLANELALEDYQVYLADIQFNECSLGLAKKHPNVFVVKLDLTISEDVSKVILKIRPDYVYHFASLIDRTRAFTVFEKMYEVNVMGTYHLLMALTDIEYKMFSFSSTSEVYGLDNDLPFHEEQFPQPVSPYSLTKMMAEKLIQTWALTYSKPWLIFRIFNFFGPGMPTSTFFPELLEALINERPFSMTPGEQKRDYLYIEDLIWYLKQSVMTGTFNQEIVNVCSGKSVSMKEIVSGIQEFFDYRSCISYDKPYRNHEIWEIRGSNVKIQEAFPRHRPLELKEGIAKLIRAIR